MRNRIFQSLMALGVLITLGFAMALVLMVTDAPRETQNLFLPLLVWVIAAKWPFIMLALAYYVTPAPSSEPPKNLQKHKDRIWFAKTLLVLAATVYAFEVAYMSGCFPSLQ
jgi:hypothetical protein